jgi:hypothetical protein
MIRRFRPVVALLALLTLFAYVAEGAAALVLCSPVETESHEMAGAPAAHEAPDHGASPSAGTHSETQHGNDCPIGMTSGGSCAVASLPSALTHVQTVPVTAEPTWSAAAMELDSTPAHPLFHPPRA